MAQTRPSPTLSRGFTRLGRFLAPYAIIAELRAIREAYAARFNYDVGAMFRDIRARQEASGREYVRLPVVGRDGRDRLPVDRCQAPEHFRRSRRREPLAAVDVTHHRGSVLLSSTMATSAARSGRISAHGNAGEASIFFVLANKKLRPEGAIALVMPLSLMSGEAWEKSRRLLAKSYCDLGLVSITGAADEEMSFAADTDMGDARRWHRHADPVPCRVEEHATTRGRAGRRQPTLLRR